MPILKAISNESELLIAVPKIYPTIRRLTGINLPVSLLIEFEDIAKNRKNWLIEWHSNFCEQNYLLDQCLLAKEIRLAEIGLVDYDSLSESVKERI